MANDKKKKKKELSKLYVTAKGILVQESPSGIEKPWMDNGDSDTRPEETESERG